ncbi:MAG: nucleotidyltransferase [Oceanospirillales bacterium]|nr:nucleotidyltransferase [Marinobacter sp.]MBI44265.1 nucleotidyltransferase [Oceanospirillales bacterium]|tara:strand:+ start:5154 stop:5510 length:357 start_codon:yes stop_codon:yes gene_type:complete
MSDASQREWRFYLDDMIDFAGKALAYTEGLDQTGFVTSGLTYDATLRNLELLGEAATHIPDEIRAAHPEIPWRMIIATRNRLIHGYLGIDDDTLWSIIQDDVPELLPLLQAIKNEAQS